MARLIHILLLGLIGAAILHIAIVFLVPIYSEQNAWSRLVAKGDAYTFIRLDGRSAPTSNRDPLMREAACHFDLSDGPVHITADGLNLSFWSLSLYAPNGDNLYSFNDSIAANRQLDLIIGDAIGLAALRADNQPTDKSTLMLEQNIGEGAIILRAFVPNPSWNQVADAFFDNAECAPLDN